MTKHELRERIRQCRRQHDGTDEAAAILARLLQDGHMAGARTVLLYHALPDEVPTQQLLDKLAAEGRTVLLPRVTSDTDMELRRYTSAANLRTGAFHILEPTGPLFTDYSLIDVAVVPGMAFDRKGHRLGRGKGYYDRMLARLSADNSRLYKIGICFSWQLVERVPCDAHDVVMDRVVSRT